MRAHRTSPFSEGGLAEERRCSPSVSPPHGKGHFIPTFPLRLTANQPTPFPAKQSRTGSDRPQSSKKKLIGLGPKSKLKHSRSRETTNAAPKMESKPAEKSPEAACAMIPNGFTDVDREEMKQAFDLFDKNHDGKISSEELGCVLRTLGWEYTQVEVEEMIKNADTNENGFVEYDEFLVMMKKWSGQASLPSVDEKTREAFRVFDMDGNGYIDKHELRYVMRRLGENLSEDDIRDMFKEADLNEDGKIDFNEFRQLLGTCKLK